MGTPPDFDAYVAAMHAHGSDLVQLETDVLTLTMLLASVQLALRHPAYPDRMRGWVEPWLAQAIAATGTVSPIIQATLEAGNDGTQDVRCEEERP